MIVNIRHKGIQLFYEEGNGSKLPPQFLRKINRLLDQLDAVTSVSDMLQMGSGIHKLTGDMADFWSVSVTANYRLAFRFEKGDVFDLDYIDYY
jgi:toxin HigB-1